MSEFEDLMKLAVAVTRAGNSKPRSRRERRKPELYISRVEETKKDGSKVINFDLHGTLPFSTASMYGLVDEKGKGEIAFSVIQGRGFMLRKLKAGEKGIALKVPNENASYVMFNRRVNDTLPGVSKAIVERCDCEFNTFSKEQAVFIEAPAEFWA